MKAWLPWLIVIISVGSGIEALIEQQYIKAGYWMSAAMINTFAIFL